MSSRAPGSGTARELSLISVTANGTQPDWEPRPAPPVWLYTLGSLCTARGCRVFDVVFRWPHSQALASLGCFKNLSERFSSTCCWFDQVEKHTIPSTNAGSGTELCPRGSSVWERIVLVPHFLTTEISLFRKSVPNTMIYHKLKQFKHKSHLESVNFQISIIRPQNALSSVYAFIYQKTII